MNKHISNNYLFNDMCKMIFMRVSFATVLYLNITLTCMYFKLISNVVKFLLLKYE